MTKQQAAENFVQYKEGKIKELDRDAINFAIVALTLQSKYEIPEDVKEAYNRGYKAGVEAYMTLCRDEEEESNKDVISRKMAIDAIGDKADEMASNENRFEVIGALDRLGEEAINILRNLPPVKLKPAKSYDVDKIRYALDKFNSWLNCKEYSWGERNMLRAVINVLREIDEY